MKKTAALIAGAMTLTSFTAAADAIGVYAGAQVWDMAAEGNHGDGNGVQEYNFSDATQGRFYVAFEHPIPFIPNIKIAHSELVTDGPEIGFGDSNFGSSEIDFTYVDYTLYYELFDNGLFSFDLGATVKDFDGDLISEGGSGFDNENVEEIIPMLYASAKVGLPFTGLEAFAEGNFLSFDDSTFTDYQVGISYALIDNMLIDVNLSAGYRIVDVDLEDVDDVYADMKFDGAFAGVEVHF